MPLFSSISLGKIIVIQWKCFLTMFSDQFDIFYANRSNYLWNHFGSIEVSLYANIYQIYEHGVWLILSTKIAVEIEEFVTLLMHG